MLTVHQSNRLDALAGGLADVLAKPLASVFASEVVVVQSRGVARWLSLRLADRSGVCANVRFPFPAAFTWDLYRCAFGNLPEQSSLDPGVLTWRILDLLPELEDSAGFAAVKRYVAGSDLRRFELAARLAALYDEYLVYRPDWIASWERKPSADWQGQLWRRLSAESAGAHSARLNREFMKLLATHAAPVSIPQRVCVFGAPALAPSVLELFSALASLCEVHLFIQNPCRAYWGDIASERTIARKRVQGKSDAAYLETGNSLLASFGKQGRDFIDLLAALSGEGPGERDHFVEPGRETLLASVQSDILDLEELTASVAAAHLDVGDVSLQVHSCHGAMREVEVLHDQLLALFSRFADLEPSDVVVMMPDVESYAPYIEAVFATAKPHIPFNISDRSSERESTLAGTLMRLIELSGSRYDANSVLAILDEDAVRRRFGLGESDVETVRRWVRESQIRWGIDATHRASFGLPATHEHTWRFGLERLMLGYALPARNERVFEGVLAYDEIEGGLGDVLGRFVSFVEAAIAIDADFANAKPIARWCSLMQTLIATFFDPAEERAEELEALRSVVAGLDRDVRAARYGGAVPLSVLVSALRSRLEVPGRAFLSGGVTFCAMVPMRSLPFEVVCMIGMNDRSYPRVRRREGFDLMSSDVRKGDRSRRDDDRYLFLESLLNARRCLYLSYTGRHIREDTVFPPSVVVSELLDYVARGNRTVRENLVTQHPLQAFSPRYFRGNAKLFTYSETLARAASVAGHGTREEEPLLTSALAEPGPDSRRVELDTFVRFFRNPAKHLCEQRLKIRLQTREEELDTHEPFELAGLPLFDLKQRLLDLRLRDVAEDGLMLARAGGDLPHGRMGDALFAVEEDRVNRVANVLSPLVADTSRERLPFELELGAITLTGSLANFGPDGMLDYRMSSTNEHLRIRAWIRHLVLNALAPAGIGRTCRCITQECVLTFSSVPDARAKLVQLADLYWRGQQEAIHFFPRSAWAYVNANEDDVGSRVRSVWQGSEHDEEATRRAERNDPYYDLAFRGTDALDERFKAASRTVFGSMLEFMTEKPLP